MGYIIAGESSCGCCARIDRRAVVSGAVAMLFAAAARGRAPSVELALPSQVAGISIPRTPLTRRATELAGSAYPKFLFNHCMRTYLLGALSVRAERVAFDPQIAFVAASLHDLGLLRGFASARGSFEVDGANRAEALMRQAGRAPAEGRRVWNAIVAHDMNGVYAAHQSPEAELVNAGAGADVVGPGDLDRKAVAEVLQAFPRLEFKRQFTALLVDHCRRKPTSEIGWLDGLCRRVAPNASRPSVEREIMDAPYSE
ncbi:MAG: hypothetical protein ACREUT_14215 [Steroidobacteraceae bacterium]